MGRVDTLVTEIQQINNNYKNVLTKIEELSPKLQDVNNKMLAIVDSIGTSQTNTQQHVTNKFDSIIEYLQEQFDGVIKKADAVVLPDDHKIKTDKILTKINGFDAEKINNTIQKIQSIDVADVQNKIKIDTKAIVGQSENQIKNHITQEVTKVSDTVKPLVEGIQTLVFNSNRPNEPDEPDTQMQYDNYTALVEDFKVYMDEMNTKFTELSKKITESATQYDSQMRADSDFSALLTQAQLSFSSELTRILNNGLSPIINQLSEQDKLAYTYLQNANATLDDQIKQKVTQKENLDKEIQSMQFKTIQFQQTHKDLIEQIAERRQTIDNLQSTIKQLKTNQQDVDTEKSIQAQRIRQEITQGQMQIVQQQKNIQELQSQETELNNKIALLSGQLSQATKQLGTDNVTIQGLNERIQILTKDIEKKRQEQTNLTEYTSHLNGLSDELNAKIQEKEQRAKRLDQEVKLQLDKLDEAVSKLNSVKSSIQQQIVLNTRLEKENQKHEERIAKLARDSLSQKPLFTVSDKKRPSTAVEKQPVTTSSQQKLTSNTQQQVESPSSLIQKSFSQKQLNEKKQDKTHQIDLGFEQSKSKPNIKRAWTQIEPSLDYQKPSLRTQEELKQEFEENEQDRIQNQQQEQMQGQGSSDSDEYLVEGLEQINTEEESSDTLWLILAGVIGGVAVGGCVYKHWKDKRRQDDSN